MNITKRTYNLITLSIGLMILFSLATPVTADAPTSFGQEELQMLQKLKAATNDSQVGLEMVKHPDGSVAVDLQGHFQEVLLGRLRPEDGTLETKPVGNFEQAITYLGLNPTQVDAALANAPAVPPLVAEKINEQTLNIEGSQGTIITLILTDDPGKGFNDPRPATPVGGNSGTTLGEQRLIALKKAAAIWADALETTVPIRIQARFDSLLCTQDFTMLGYGGPISIKADFPANGPFPGAEFPHTWYPIALANKLSGLDLDPTKDDLGVTLNSQLDEDCLGPDSRWYYGLDNQPATGQDNMVVVLLHEFAHGLGFLEFADEETGANLLGRTDIYSHFIFDTTLGAHWSDLPSGPEGDALRQASAINTDNLVWDGPHVRAAAPNYMTGHLPHLRINNPANIADSYFAVAAEFGASISQTSHISGAIVQVEDDTVPSSDGCESLTNGTALQGKLALIDRGICPFTDKVSKAQAAGAIGVIVVNNTAEPPLIMLGDDPTITIPAVMISQKSGSTIKTALAQGVEGILELSPMIAGIDKEGRVLLYTPNPVEPGSSVKHWVPAASPDLLMEPAINPIPQTQPLDLTLALMQDIGWFSDTSFTTYLPILLK